MINLDNKKFISIENTNNGEVSSETIFYYHQRENIVWADYSGGNIIKGYLIATMYNNGNLKMKYLHINKNNDIMTGECESELNILSNGKIRYNEKWKWTSGDYSTGESIIEEL